MKSINGADDRYVLSVADEYGFAEDCSFENVYEAQEMLLDALDRAIGPCREWELQALLAEVESEIRIRGEE